MHLEVWTFLPFILLSQKDLGCALRSEVNCYLLSSGSDYVVHSFRMDLSSVLTCPYPEALSGGVAKQKIKKTKNQLLVHCIFCFAISAI